MNQKSIEEQIAEVEREVYGGNMPAHNKQVLRAVLETGTLESKEWQRYVANEEREHSHSPVGDLNNAHIYENNN